jgi:hypothetical protein
MLENLFLKEHVRKYLEVIKASGGDVGALEF